MGKKLYVGNLSYNVDSSELAPLGAHLGLGGHFGDGAAGSQPGLDFARREHTVGTRGPPLLVVLRAENDVEL